MINNSQINFDKSIEFSKNSNISNSQTKKNIVIWIDALKGIGIILVAYGHIAIIPPDRDISPLVRYVYIFHMPLFFAISGYLYKFRPLSELIKSRIYSLLIPYFSFLLLITLLLNIEQAAYGSLTLRDGFFSIGRLIVGGTFLHLEVGVFWFLTCMFFVQTIYTRIMEKFGPSPIDKNVLIFMFGLFLLSSTISLFVDRIPSPLGINAIPFGLVSFWAGALIKRYEQNKIVTVLPILIVLAWISLEISGIKFEIDMKYGKYKPAFLVEIASLAIVCLIFAIARTLFIGAVSRLFAHIGCASLVIMALHNYFHFIGRRLGMTSDIQLLIISTALPFIIYLIFVKFKTTRILFLGMLGTYKN